MLITKLERFIQEDIGPDDTSYTILPETWVYAVVIAKEDGVLCGLEEAQQVFDYFGLESNSEFKDGDLLQAGDMIVKICGPVRDVLQAERLSLNFLCKMSGIATLTARCVNLASGVRVACTRKTTPGFREFEKKAVRYGGGDSHRYGLSDAIMIKDNYMAVMTIEEALKAAKQKGSFTKKIEVEVSNSREMLSAARAGADIIMFDNMQPGEIVECINTLNDLGLRNHIILEASGGIVDTNITQYAATGVDVISMGSLVHAQWLDMSLKITTK
ncbi:MAG: carboxylating nicotinate-nucleotide diphosphorylase [Methanosarcinales archaeon]|nr:carboxylating nicotinate-nucleotide diphosphorylase [Methanosarcinales archaeon]